MRVLALHLIFHQWLTSSFLMPSVAPRCDVPTHLSRYLRANIHMKVNFHGKWEKIDPDPLMTARVVDRYFGTAVAQGQFAEAFLIEGVPAALMLYTANNTHDMPIVDSFHMNKGLLCLFNASSEMRVQLHSRYGRLTVSRAANADDFLCF